MKMLHPLEMPTITIEQSTKMENKILKKWLSLHDKHKLKHKHEVDKYKLNHKHKVLGNKLQEYFQCTNNIKQFYNIILSLFIGKPSRKIWQPLHEMYVMVYTLGTNS